MSNIKSSSSIIILDEEIDRLIYLCTRIAQMASNIRFTHLSNISYSPENIQLLLSMAENIEGSVIFLESLLNLHKKDFLFFNEKNKSIRIHYTREKLLQLRKNVTFKLSNDIGFLLKQVVQRECNDSVEIERKSWRDIRTILM
jgi:hypothetical protein